MCTVQRLQYNSMFEESVAPGAMSRLLDEAKSTGDKS
jgi:hypothetical protein